MSQTLTLGRTGAHPAAAARPPAARVRDFSTGYELPLSTAATERWLTLAFMVFALFSTLEAPLRWAFSLIGAAALIYIRDAALILAGLALWWQQLLAHRVQAALGIFVLMVFFHGVIGLLLCGVPLAVLMGLKMLLYPAFGALYLPQLLKNSRPVALIMLLIWFLTAAGVILDHAGYPMPWKGMSTSVGDYTVVVNRKWNYEGEDRLGGFARDSVTAGVLAALPGIWALVFLRSMLLRAVIAAGTVAIIWLTTSKGGVLAYLIAVCACMLPGRARLLARLLLAGVVATMMLCPIILPYYNMPDTLPAGLLSFIDRIERVWPASWHNIAEHSWIFGAGIGNIGLGQQYLKYEGMDTANNMLVMFWGYFGVFCLVYLLLPVFATLRRRCTDIASRWALITLIYVYAYGIVANVIESPMVTFALGSALQALALRPARGRDP